jgi:hypothetical protein
MSACRSERSVCSAATSAPTVTVSVTLPSGVFGEFFITVWSDAHDEVTENTLAVNINPDDPSELDNNNYKARPITVVLTPPPDLVVTAVQPQARAIGGEPFTVRWSVKNRGNNQTFDAARRPPNS